MQGGGYQDTGLQISALVLSAKCGVPAKYGNFRFGGDSWIKVDVTACLGVTTGDRAEQRSRRFNASSAAAARPGRSWVTIFQIRP